MADPFIGEIRAVGFNFPPKGWAVCNGALLGIKQNTALFSILGTLYGGNGSTTFGVPYLLGRVPVGAGTGPGLSTYVNGQTGGAAQVTLNVANAGVHSHALMASAADGIEQSPAGSMLAAGVGIGQYAAAPSALALNNALVPVGSGGPHNNMMPYQASLYIIALQGIFPAHQ